jgi:hypothetical protein
VGIATVRARPFHNPQAAPTPPISRSSETGLFPRHRQGQRRYVALGFRHMTDGAEVDIAESTDFTLIFFA